MYVFNEVVCENVQRKRGELSAVMTRCVLCVMSRSMDHRMNWMSMWNTASAGSVDTLLCDDRRRRSHVGPGVWTPQKFGCGVLYGL